MSPPGPTPAGLVADANPFITSGILQRFRARLGL